MASGGDIVSKVAVMYSPGMNEKKIKRQSKILRNEAKKFAWKMNKPFKYKPSFGHLVWFAVFKSLYQGEADESSADYRYYSTKEFFADEKLSSGQKFTFNMFKAMFGFLIRIGMI